MGEISNTFEEYLTVGSSRIPVLEFSVSLLVTAALAATLASLFALCGRSQSNRKRFASNFVLLAATTMIIISVVKSSLALSLGLVGALSIVRFRSAIKDPEELAYLFLTIAIGLGMGAGQWLITVTGFVIVAGILLLKYVLHRAEDGTNLLLTVSSAGDPPVEFGRLVDLLKQECSSVDLKRLDVSGTRMEAAFQVAFDSFQQLEAGKARLFQLDKSLQVTLLDNRGLI